MEEFWRGRLSPDACAASGAADARTHLVIATEALGGLAAALGLGAPFAASALARLSIHSAEIEIAGAAKAGDAVRLTGGVAGWAEDGLTAAFAHSDAEGGVLARSRIAARHVSARSFEAFPWPFRVTEAFGRLPAEDAGGPASEGGEPPALDDAEAAGFAIAGRGVFGASEADMSGRVTADAVLGRMLDAGDTAAARASLILHIPALPGRPFLILTRPGGAMWMLDAASGRALAELSS